MFFLSMPTSLKSTNGFGKPRGQQGGLWKRLLWWRAMESVKQPSWDLSHPSQCVTAALYKAVSSWHTFHGNAFGNYQKHGSANILTS